MRYILLFAALMSLLTAHARVKAVEYKVENRVPKYVVVNNIPSTTKTTCGCASTGDCECWEGQCGCSACKSAATKTAQPSLNIDPDHYCDRCGSYSNVVARQANGMHSHVCTNPSCTDPATGRRTEWWHADPGAATPLSYSIPSSAASPCANGNCPSPSRTSRRGIFR